MVEIGYMFKINNKASVSLKKAVPGQQIQPILHIVDGFEIMQGGVQGYVSSLCLDHDNGGSQKGMNALPGFNRHFYRYIMIQVDGIFHIAEEALPVQRF